MAVKVNLVHYNYLKIDVKANRDDQFGEKEKSVFALSSEASYHRKIQQKLLKKMKNGFYSNSPLT